MAPSTFTLVEQELRFDKILVQLSEPGCMIIRGARKQLADGPRRSQVVLPALAVTGNTGRRV